MFTTYLDRHEARHVQSLSRFLEIPSISAISEHKADVQAAALWLQEYLRGIGLERVEILPTAGHPVVCGEWMGRPGAPTALIYGHYDVQPVDPLHLWTSPPFRPTVRDGKVFARGASDDKGQVVAHLQAIEALLQTDGKLPVNVKVLIEGEEEVGSPNLEPFLTTYPDRCRADVVVISDTSMFDHGLPTICCGLRGICDLEVHVRTGKSDLHSGLYGGAVANPIHVLAELLASVREGGGRIRIPGFYDHVVELGPEEREAMRALPFDEEKLVQRLGVPALDGEPGYSAIERISVRPTLEVNGIWGGFQGEGPKTVIPNEAHAKITCRLVPDQDPLDIRARVAAYLQAHCPPSATIDVKLGHTARPWRCSPQSAPVQAAERALEATFARPVAMARMGGSIPVVEMFDRLLGVPCVLMGFASPDSNAHAPDESFPLDTFRLARKSIGRFWHELAAGYDA